MDSTEIKKVKFYEITPSGEVKEVGVEIPSNVAPLNTGDFFITEIQKKLSDFPILSATANAVSATAVAVEKEGWRLSKVVVSVGFPQIFNVNFEFDKKASK